MGRINNKVYANYFWGNTNGDCAHVPYTFANDNHTGFMNTASAHIWTWCNQGASTNGFLISGTENAMYPGSAGGMALGKANQPWATSYFQGVSSSGTLAVTGLSSLAGNSAFVASDFTTANNSSLQTITGLTFNLPATAYVWKYHCALAYSQSTANAAVAFGVQAATTNPNNIFGVGEEQITAGLPSTSTRGVLTGLNTTAATTIVSGTPGATGTNYMVMLDGTIENPAAANTVNFMVSTASGADAVTVRRGSECQIW
jgi:hypothetical protein